MIPFAPDRLSTTTGLPKDSESFWVIRRPSTSAGPPAGNGTTSLIGLVGYDCANAARPHTSEASKALIANTVFAKRYPTPLSILFEFGMLPPRITSYGKRCAHQNGPTAPRRCLLNRLP